MLIFLHFPISEKSRVQKDFCEYAKRGAYDMQHTMYRISYDSKSYNNFRVDFFIIIASWIFQNFNNSDSPACLILQKYFRGKTLHFIGRNIYILKCTYLITQPPSSMFQLTYVTFYFGHFSLTTKPETNWTQKDLCPPITEHHVNVRFTFKSVFLTGF